VVAQRLARRLCERCKAAYAPSRAEIQAMRWDEDYDDVPRELFRPVGCGNCGQKGYLGRFALHEVLLVTEEIETLIAERAHSEDIKKISMSQGMQTLRQAGLAQMRAGLTSMEEILRVVA
jgi:type IV pilus assembly protein PilB